ncbi:MAG: DUF1013 domain-containing protein [Parvibaculales bacterium]
MTTPLMPKATAVWLIDNTALTFDQIALFCGLHPLEVKGIANGDVAQGIKGMDPISSGQLTRSEIERCQEDPTSELQIADSKREIPAGKPRKTTKYTPLSKRQERPDAIAWLVRNHAELRDSEISRLVGTTKPTIQSIRDRSHWNISNITPTDPVTLGLCTQIELDEVVAKAALREQRRLAKLAKEQGNTGEVLKDAAETTAIGATPNADLITGGGSDLGGSSEPAEPASEAADTASEPRNLDDLRPEDVFGN